MKRFEIGLDHSNLDEAFRTGRRSVGYPQPAIDPLWDSGHLVKPVSRPWVRARKQGQSPTASVWLDAPRPKTAARTLSDSSTKRSVLFSVVLAFGLTLRMAWTAVVLPFRLIVWVLALLGRLAALAVGFSLMVFGAALLPSSLFFVGLPVFGLGLVMTLRSVE